MWGNFNHGSTYVQGQTSLCRLLKYFSLFVMLKFDKEKEGKKQNLSKTEVKEEKRKKEEGKYDQKM